MMSKVPAKQSDDQLKCLAAEIQEQVALCERSARTTLEHGRAIGERLSAAKQLVGHGQWKHWVEANLSFSIDTAERMMKLHREWDRLNSAPVRLLGIKDAIAYLAAEKKKAKQDQPAAEKTVTRAERKQQPERGGDDSGGAGKPSTETAKASIARPTCPNCGNNEFDDDGDCTKCLEPRVCPGPKAGAEPNDAVESMVDVVVEDEPADEIWSVRDCYVDPGEADWHHPVEPFAEDVVEDLEDLQTDMEIVLERMLNHDVINSLSEHDPLKADLLRLQRAMEQVRAGLTCKRPGQLLCDEQAA
jgi:hypothetical protein